MRAWSSEQAHLSGLASFQWLAVATAAAWLSWPVSAHDSQVVRPDLVGTLRSLPRFALAGPAAAPVYQPDVVPAPLMEEFARKSYKLDPKSGNYLAPKVHAKTLNEGLVPVLIGGNYVKDIRGNTVFLRESIRDKLVKADAAMFAKKRKHIGINFGFRSNALQGELYKKLNGKGKVAPAGGSFHETGMALDLHNWRDAQKFMIEAGFVGGCYGIEEDLVHYSISEISKASRPEAFKRCTLKEIPENILKGSKKAGKVAVGAVKKPKSIVPKGIFGRR